MGVCGPSKQAGACNASVDVLGSYLRDASFRERHSECAGFCLQRSCTPFSKVGDTCKSDEMCGPGNRCIAKVCTKVDATKLGPLCGATSCDEGSKCANDKCVAPHKEGEPCQSDSECRGECKKPTDGASATCGPVCKLDLMKRNSAR
jgi:hypothetical protein